MDDPPPPLRAQFTGTPTGWFHQLVRDLLAALKRERSHPTPVNTNTCSCSPDSVLVAATKDWSGCRLLGFINMLLAGGLCTTAVVAVACSSLRLTDRRGISCCASRTQQSWLCSVAASGDDRFIPVSPISGTPSTTCTGCTSLLPATLCAVDPGAEGVGGEVDA